MASERIRRVLIVEDEALVAEDIQQQLRQLGYSIAGTVDAGDEAVRQAFALHPDLVLMDIQLKGAMDGIEAARQIKVTCALPVVFLTGHFEPEVLRRAKETEPYGFILKPFSQRDLMVQLEMALYRWQLEVERSQLREELEVAHENLRKLHGLLPLCSGCKKIREEDGYWAKLEDYLKEHANVEFTHGFCPECEAKFYGTRPPIPEMPLVVERKKNPRRKAAG
ncbi:response regulator [Opitutaceae bacterium EW11]|nr:response regulator [Opitutaceae bacterium EW11]